MMTTYGSAAVVGKPIIKDFYPVLSSNICVEEIAEVPQKTLDRDLTNFVNLNRGMVDTWKPVESAYWQYMKERSFVNRNKPKSYTVRLRHNNRRSTYKLEMRIA